MTNKIKIVLAAVGMLLFVAGIFWFSTQTQNIQEPQTIQKQADDNTGSFLCSWQTGDGKPHTFEVQLVDLAGNIIAKNENVFSNITSREYISEYKFSDIPREKLFGVRCQVRIVNEKCDVSFTRDSKVTSCPKGDTTTKGGTGTPIVISNTATPGDTSTKGGTGTPTATPGDTSTRGGTATPTATPGDTSTRGGTATPGSGAATATPGSGTATATPAAATATAAAKAAATGVAATATSGAAATATRATSSSSSSSSTATVTSTSTTSQSTSSLPASGMIHPAIILGIISLFVIALGLVL